MAKKPQTFQEFLDQFDSEQCFTCGNKNSDCPECGGYGFYCFEDGEMYTRKEMQSFYDGSWVK